MAGFLPEFRADRPFPRRQDPPAPHLRVPQFLMVLLWRLDPRRDDDGDDDGPEARRAPRFGGSSARVSGNRLKLEKIDIFS